VEHPGQEIALIVFDTPANLPGTPTFDPTKPISPGSDRLADDQPHGTFGDATHATSSGTNAFFTAAGVQYRGAARPRSSRR
jgi:hypothetical protein